MTEQNNKEQVQFITLQKATRKRYEDKWKTKTLIKFFVLIKSMRQHKPKSIQITKVFNPLKSLYYESQMQRAGHHILLVSHFYKLLLKSKKEA